MTIGHIFAAVKGFFGFPRHFRVAQLAEPPDRTKTLTVYAIGATEPWLAILQCPCGCGEDIHLSLLKNDSPHWGLSVGKRKAASLKPSVWRTEGCRSHFILKDGLVRWCK